MITLVWYQFGIDLNNQGISVQESFNVVLIKYKIRIVYELRLMSSHYEDLSYYILSFSGYC